MQNITEEFRNEFFQLYDTSGDIVYYRWLTRFHDRKGICYSCLGIDEVLEYEEYLGKNQYWPAFWEKAIYENILSISSPQELAYARLNPPPNTSLDQPPLIFELKDARLLSMEKIYYSISQYRFQDVLKKEFYCYDFDSAWAESMKQYPRGKYNLLCQALPLDAETDPYVKKPDLPLLRLLRPSLEDQGGGSELEEVTIKDPVLT
ncbi:MAG: hypothetical protein KC535_02005 [Nanoarchaeota archaeon]|nr:hypothetical protein [Nanoarchaeota archaeon]